MGIEGRSRESADKRVRLGMVGGGEGAFIGAVHRLEQSHAVDDVVFGEGHRLEHAAPDLDEGGHVDDGVVAAQPLRQPLVAKVGYFAMILIPVIVLTFYTVAKSGRLSEFLEVLSDERESTRAKFNALAKVWRRSPTDNVATPRTARPPAPAPTVAKTDPVRIG